MKSVWEEIWVADRAKDKPRIPDAPDYDVNICFDDEARERLAACAPEAIRLLLEAELGGTEHGNTACCPWCRGGEPYKGKKYEQASHKPDCRWQALMKKAGVR